jgi:hypothetical protein
MPHNCDQCRTAEASRSSSPCRVEFVEVQPLLAFRRNMIDLSSSITTVVKSAVCKPSVALKSMLQTILASPRRVLEISGFRCMPCLMARIRD